MSAISLLLRWFQIQNDDGEVPIARRPVDGLIPPAHRPAALAGYEGRWVALLHGEVIASAENSRDLAAVLRSMGSHTQDSVMQYVRPPVSGYVVGVG